MIEIRKRIWLLRAVAAIVTIASIYLFAPWREALAYLKPLPATVQAELDHVLDYGLDGIIVYVDRAGHEPEFYAAGWHDREARIPADPHALFKIASISKLYIAAATAMLVADGRLDLDDTVADYFPDLVGQLANADRITLRMLLQHRSGIPNWVEDPDRWAITSGEVNDYLALVFDDPAEFEPGTRYQYSNTNYLLIGNILDQTLGHPHQQFIRSAILDPLGLTNTFASMDDVDLTRIPGGYDPGWPEENFRSRVHIVPGGTMVATAEDTGIFLRALNDGSLFTDEEQAIYSSVYEYGHTGLLAGYSSIARYHADIDAVVVQFVNTSGGNTWTATEVVYDRIVRILRREE
ncbi:serine hydrolase domain-containing protein [uncultured Maricaulis sp.]|uniref:serine hydrolase domain-containing protein n=1 Tax=uncultured Maricaulis sp. TaxID=174710 RepID=UPI0030D7AC76|tara:strand:+ start:1196 stop:2245 length:1050 start_codon:yes stop_codon:yes gene_type:complete